MASSTGWIVLGALGAAWIVALAARSRLAAASLGAALGVWLCMGECVSSSLDESSCRTFYGWEVPGSSTGPLILALAGGLAFASTVLARKRAR